MKIYRYKISANIYQSFGKRIFDVALALPALVFFSPLLVCIALLVRINLGKPVFFRQVRPGLHGKPFTILKFRTMSEKKDAEGYPLPDVERLTRLGRFLRSSSLDELPELMNVVIGDMSLVGPRPLLMQYLDRYTVEQARRHEVKPGITGWAQVNGRNLALFSKRLKMDVEYVHNLSLLLDIRILFLTIKKVLRREDVIVDQAVHEIDDLDLYSSRDGVSDVSHDHR